MQAQEHWQNVYQNKKPDEVSWYEEFPTMSLDLIKATNIEKDKPIIDIGGGASILVDKLLDEGFRDLSVLDISERSLQYAKDRLGKQANNINWIVADVTEYKFKQTYNLWHDRAVFHFLTEAAAREKYKQALNQALVPGAYLILATFALDGSNKCSGLEVERYDANKLQAELGSNFSLLQSIDTSHITPWDSKQKFTYGLFRKCT